MLPGVYLIYTKIGNYNYFHFCFGFGGIFWYEMGVDNERRQRKARIAVYLIY